MEENLTPQGDDEPTNETTENAHADLIPASNGDGNGLNGANGAVDLNVGFVRAVMIEQEMRTAYLDYAMSVIVARALPDRAGRPQTRASAHPVCHARHGPQPIQPLQKKRTHRRRSAWASIIHTVTLSIYDAMARMAQDFSLRYPLVDGPGQLRLHRRRQPGGHALHRGAPGQDRRPHAPGHRDGYGGLDPNFDDSLQEPTVLPAMLPNFLVNGTSGIAVGMATNVPPHNLSEIADAIVYVIDNWERHTDIGLEELMDVRQGAGLPHRRHHPGHRGHSPGLRHGPRPRRRARPDPDRGDEATTASRSSSPRSPTR